MRWRASGAPPAVPLIAVAHGSRDPRAAATVEDLLDLVRRQRPDVPVRTAYLDHAPPTLAMALSGVSEAAVLPLLLTEAYHSRVDIPGALAEAASRHPRLRAYRGATLGPHPLLVAALERRLAEAGVTAGDPGTAVVLVSAGSSDARANATVSGIAHGWAARRGWWSVTAAYASAAGPTPQEAVLRLRRSGASRVVVAPYLLAPGHFADKIRRETLAAGADAVSDVLGAAPELATVLLERYGQAVHTGSGARSATA
ncbi:sirohydrochlorin ferrochelatase [Streptosporangium becharense]|uniref:Sirohydrochlorin ferrochelatase n=1 Tax=Streptosporangium becharense TaxID=1816182 RepID=A0A7W9MJ92_9ACTN|nr:sirohydrochlorin ferrochelatase [Streptosporangium becharense]MBB5822416.1 sirohydrochlorin ferrochelatase [Streptosporangium becharense]